MSESLSSRLKRAWNVFFNKDPTPYSDFDNGGYSYRMDRTRLRPSNDKSMVTSLYNRIAMDVSAIDIKHVRLDDQGRYLETIDSGLNNCLSLEANIDQTYRAFVQDIVMSMFDEGNVAVVPIDTMGDPKKTNSYDILTMRTGKIVTWYPRHVKVCVYNDRKGIRENITLPKEKVAIIENPFYAVMNEPNSTLKRLIRKLALLDMVDEQSGSGKLDLIIQLPYIIKSEARKQQAEARRREIESQLENSKYGIAYTDGTEHITQLNRSLENNLLKQIEYLTNTLYSQLGLTPEIMNDTAKEEEMLNYQTRTIEPIVSAIVDELRRKFLTKTARSQGQDILFFSDPFKLVPASKIADMADKFTTAEILSSNELRQILGFKPSLDPMADQLRNRHLNVTEEQTFATTGDEYPAEGEAYPEEQYQEEPYSE